MDVEASEKASKEWAYIGNFVEYIGFEPNVAGCQQLKFVPSNYVSSEKFYPCALLATSEHEGLIFNLEKNKNWIGEDRYLVIWDQLLLESLLKLFKYLRL